MNIQDSNYDSEFCGSLPLNQTNLIQSYGVLLVIDKDGKIIQASENCDKIFGLNAALLTGTSVITYVGDSFTLLSERIPNDSSDKIPFLWKIKEREFVLVAHRKRNDILVEIEIDELRPQEQNSFIEVYQELKYVMARIEAADTIDAACKVAADELKRISGFDKVMIYKFDELWNGTVVAEAMELEMESYFGLTFPASDIPKQARMMYQKNPYRYIPDRTYKAVQLFPVINPNTKTFTDLSDCNLRSVASVHLEYLANMNVVCSMSTRIIKDNALWGLISCHHREARKVPYQLCSIFEMLSGIISTKITSIANQLINEFKVDLTGKYAAMIEEVYRSERLDKTLMSGQGVRHVFNATGAAIFRRDKIEHSGEVPSYAHLDDLYLWIQTRSLTKVLETDNGASLFVNASEYKEHGSGLMIIPMNYSEHEYLVLFRPEVVRVVSWGGNPEDRIQFEADNKKYHPRNSFKQWQEKLSGYSRPWNAEEVKMAESLRSFLYEYQTSMV